MDVSERIENLGGYGNAAYAGCGGIGLFLLAIFLIILFAAFRRDQHNAHDCASVANCLGEFHPREGCADKLTWARYANYMDPEVARNHTEIVRSHGSLEKQQVQDTGEIKYAMQQQTHELILGQERNTWAILNNQNTIARDQERQFYMAREADANRREAEKREENLALKAQLLAAEQQRDADRRHWELLTSQNQQFCLVNNRITQIEGEMVKGVPCYAPTVPVATFSCGPRSSCGCSGAA